MPRDFPDLLEICFENREADFGRFLRRNLSATDILKFSGILSALLPPESPTMKEKAFGVIELGHKAFIAAAMERFLDKATIDDYRVKAVQGLTMQVGLILEPEKENALPTQEFLNTIASANPQYTGWPIWLDSRGFHEIADRPIVIDGAWQALIVDLNGGWSQHLEFMRFDPKGKFYLRRAMQDDLSEKVERGSVLDPVLMLYRVIEVLAVGLSVARATGWPVEKSGGFAFEWRGVKGRRLTSWADPMRMISGGGRSETDKISSFVEVPLDTPHAAIAPYARTAIAPLLAAFNGFEFSTVVIEDCVQRLVERKM